MAQSNGELHKELRECFKADPYYDEILNLTGDMGIHDIESRIIAVFEAYRKQHELETRIDELERVEVHVDSGVWTYGNDPEMAMLISERIAELEAEREKDR